MMNALALGLVLTSFVTAGFFSPTPEKVGPKDDVIVKEGHRVVVVEFEKDDGNTKVSISPQDSHEKGYATHAKERLMETWDETKEKMKEASSSVLPEAEKLGNALHYGKEEEIQHHKLSAREIVCDAYGKCKHKLASAMEKTKEAVVEKAQEAEEGAKEVLSGAFEKVKDTVAHTAHVASDKAQETKESVKDMAAEVSGRAKEKADQMRERGEEVSSRAKDKAAEMKEKAKERVHDVIDGTGRVKEEVEREAWEKMEATKGKMKEKAEETEAKVKKEGKKELSKILRRVSDVFRYMAWPLSVRPLMGVLHLLGFAAAYGTCVWVTFASSYVLAGALPKHQFGMVQSKIYPVYFKAMAYSIGLALLGTMIQKKRISSWESFNLLTSLGMVLVNLAYLEPRATKVMFERMKKEKEEGRGKEGGGEEEAGRGTTVTAGGTSTTEGGKKSELPHLSEMLRRLNSYSSFLNILTLMSLTWHLVQLGKCLDAVC